MYPLGIDGSGKCLHMCLGAIGQGLKVVPAFEHADQAMVAKGAGQVAGLAGHPGERLRGQVDLGQGVGAVGIEDTYVVTPDGAERLSGVAARLFEL